MSITTSLLLLLTCCVASGKLSPLKGNHTNNWAVLVCTSRYWFNYRHVANALSIYRSVKRLGIPDSHIILMLADDMPCNPRNPQPATTFSNARKDVNVYGSDVEVDYKGYEVFPEALVRLLTGRHAEGTPRSKRLLSDETSNVLVYLSGHGGDGFIKFQEAEEITNIELAHAFEQMWQKRRYNELLLLADTCQAASLYQKCYSPNILAAASSRVGENSLSHHDDPTLGVPVVDRWTHYILKYLEEVSPGSQKTLSDFFRYTSQYSLVQSQPTVRSDLFTRPLDRTLLTDFFGSVHDIQVTNVTAHMTDDVTHITSTGELMDDLNDLRSEVSSDSTSSASETDIPIINKRTLRYVPQFPDIR